MSRLSRSKSRVNTVSGVSNYSRVPSRRVRKEKKKVISQSILMIGAAIILLVTFIFVIIPNFFTFVSNFLDSPTPFQESDTIPPQIPIVSAPISATNSAELKIAGFGEPESKVILVLNGNKADELVITSDGSFEFPLTLSEGENKLTAYSIDAAENESALTREYSVFLDTQAPKIELLEPIDGASFQSRANQSITIHGMTDKESEVKVYINNRIVFPKADGSFSFTYQLEEGDNLVEIRAQDKAGNSNKIEVTYTFSL